MIFCHINILYLNLKNDPRCAIIIIDNTTRIGKIYAAEAIICLCT